MPDVCTLVAASTMTLQACFAPAVCTPARCYPPVRITCEGPAFSPYYDCVTEDGSHYVSREIGANVPPAAGRRMGAAEQG
ncbi:MAG: hypothetical protein P4M07_29095 [Xanthobacteraceae bacterium]|nr:hypothetical protein [Xanthobacteraceae bacterium]